MGFTARYLGITRELSGMAFKIRFNNFVFTSPKEKRTLVGAEEMLEMLSS
jgi:hypothetical protein